MKFSNGAGVKSRPCVVTFLLNYIHKLGVCIAVAGFVLHAPIHGHAQATINGTGAITGSGTAGAAAIGLSNAVLPDSLLLNWNTKVANSPSGGSTLSICATGCTYNNTQLQQAFNDIQCGQTLTIQENASYVLTSALTLPTKDAAHNGPCTANSWITIESATNAANLPAEGSRITPCSLGMTTIAGLPAYACPGTPARHLPQFMEESLGGVLIMSAYTRLIGLEVTRNNDFDLSFGLVNVGSNSTCSNPDLTCMNMQPDHVIFDRMIVHGDAQRQTTRAFNFGGARWVAVLDSYLYDITLTYAGGGGDAQVYGWGFGHDFTNVGFGKFANDFVNASAMSSIFCGAFVEPVSSATGFDGIPHDVWFSQQWLYKNPLWDTQIGATLNEAETIEGVSYGPTADQEITVQPTVVQLTTGQQFQFQSLILNDSGAGINRAPGALPPTLTCGSSDCGSITTNAEHTVGTGIFASQNQITYTYTAPLTIPTGGTVNVTFRYLTPDDRLATLGQSRTLTATSTVTVIASPATGDLYVSPSGSDTNPGTFSQPFKTITHSATVASAGQTVVVEDGTYNETVTLGVSGSSGSPIVFTSQNKWGATIQGQSGATNIVTINGSFVTLQNFEIIGAADGSNPTGVKCNTGNNCTVSGNKIHHIGTTSSSCPLGAAIEPNNGNNETVTGNFIYDVSPPRSAARCNHEQGIYSSTGTGQNANGVISNNLIVECYQCYAIQFDGGEPSGWTVTNNTIANTGQGSPNNSGGGIYFNCAVSGATCDNNLFNNNIFYNTGGDSCITEATVAPGGTNGAHNAYQNNLFSNCFGGNNFIHGSLTSSVNASPSFVSYTGDQTGDYHPAASSPAINAGTSNGSPAADFDGITRTGATWIGAYQSSGPAPPAGGATHLLAVGPAAPDLQMQPSYSDSLNNSRQFEMEFNAIPNFASGSTTWSVDGVVSGNASVGTIASQGSLGLYTSPARAGTHSICAQASDGTQGCSSITVSASAPIVGFDLKPNTSKNAWELKCGARVLLENSLAELAWGADGNGGGQPGYWLLMQTLNQANQTTDGGGNSVGYGPEHINDITVRYVKGEHFGFGLTVVPLNKSLGLHRVSLSNLVGDDINYQRWGNGFSKVMLAIQTGGTASTNILGWTSATSPVADNVTFKHITMLGNEMTPFGMVNNLAQFKLLNFTWQDSFFPAAGSATFTDPNGEANDCDTASGSGTTNTEANALVPCVTPYAFNHLALLDSTAAQNMFVSAPIWHPASAAVGFANYNGGNGGDYRLCSGVGTPASNCTAASPFAAGQAQQASDGTDLGADILGINVMESAVRSGVRTP